MYNRSAPMAAVVPMVMYEDVAATISWLSRVFGIKECLRYSENDGRVTRRSRSKITKSCLVGRDRNIRTRRGPGAFANRFLCTLKISMLTLLMRRPVEQRFFPAQRRYHLVSDHTRLLTLKVITGASRNTLQMLSREVGVLRKSARLPIVMMTNQS